MRLFLGLALCVIVAACVEPTAPISLVPKDDGQGLFGLADIKGKMVIPPQYAMVEPFGHLGYKVLPANSEEWSLIDLAGKPLTKQTYSSVGEVNFERAWFRREVGNKMCSGYLDGRGFEAIPPRYTWASNFVDGFATVTTETREHLRIDKNGKVLGIANFSIEGVMSEGLIAIVALSGPMKGKFGFISKDGVVKIEPRFYFAGGFSEGFCQVSNGKKFGYIDKDGKLFVDYILDSAEPFKNGVAKGRFKQKPCSITPNGEIAVLAGKS